MSSHTSRRLTEIQVQNRLSAALNHHRLALQTIAEEYAAKWDAEKRRQAVKNGDALPDGSFPIVDQEDMGNAGDLIGNSKHPRATIVAHMKKQAKKHGLTLPASLRDNDEDD